MALGHAKRRGEDVMVESPFSVIPRSYSDLPCTNAELNKTTNRYNRMVQIGKRSDKL